MNEIDRNMEEEIRNLLMSQRLGVLATQRNGQPYSSLMAYAVIDDLTELMVATTKSTRKHQNILEESRVSMLVDNRSNSEQDFHSAAALTILGKALLVQKDEREGYQKRYIDRHPYLQKFLTSPTTTLFKIEVYHYLLVSRFQNVMEYHIRDEMDLFT